MQKLAGASLLVFANKQDVAGALRAEEIATVGGSIAEPLVVSLSSFQDSECYLSLKHSSVLIIAGLGPQDHRSWPEKLLSAGLQCHFW